MNTITHNGIEYPEDFQKIQFEEHTDVPQDVIDKHFHNKSVLALRVAEYPNIKDQLDTIYHEGVDAWKDGILSIKTKYPKI